MPLVSVLYALAGQEGNDGDEGNAMQAAAEEIKRLNALVKVHSDNGWQKIIERAIMLIETAWMEDDGMPCEYEARNILKSLLSAPTIAAIASIKPEGT